jgi:hypothetical protein
MIAQRKIKLAQMRLTGKMHPDRMVIVNGILYGFKINKGEEGLG